jgi:uncharacterized protein (DUF2141 family)
MKTTIKILTAIVLSLSLYSFISNGLHTFSLTVEVNNLRNDKGVVQFALYNKDGTLPDENFEKYYKILKGDIVNGSAMVTFKNIPTGNYAVNILHDENMNAKIDKGFMLPEEGIGFSNYISIGLTNRPNFSKASFELNDDRKISVKVIYM